MMSLSDVKRPPDLIKYLETKGMNHEYYYHYTTWDSLLKIFHGRTFLLTRGNSSRINDQHEAIMKGSHEEWNKIYIGSFSFGSSENMAMWGLYGLPWTDAVRLAIPKKQMNQWTEHIENIYLFEDGGSQYYNEGFRVGINDIVYASGKNGEPLRLTHYGTSRTIPQTNPLYGVDKEPSVTGYIKNYAWQYENEVRLRIRLNVDTGYEKISVFIPNELLDSITITTGPNFRYKNDGLYHQLTSQHRITESSFSGLVQYRELCDMCQNRPFLKKK